MESLKLFQVHVFMQLGIQLTILACMGFLVHALSLSSEGDKYNSKSDVESQTISRLPCLKKYVTESYFQKHSTLLDPDFQNFVENELPIGIYKLELMPRLSVLQRYLIGEGSHRCLSSSFRLSIQQESMANLPRHLCKTIIIERLPSGVFADPFELQHLLQRGVFADAAVFGDTNLELPSVASNRSIVEVHLGIGHNVLSEQTNGLEIKVELPLHARYPALGKHGFSKVEFGEPDLFLHCHFEVRSQDQSCLFMPIATSESQTPKWEIPCGIKEDSAVVSVVTFVSALISAFSIVFTSIFYPSIHRSAVI